MSNTTNRTGTADPYSTFIDILADNGFYPIDDTDAESLDKRDTSIIEYYAARGYEGYRIDDDKATTYATPWATLARCSDDYGIQVQQIDRNGVTIFEATLSINTIGLAALARIL